MYFIPSFLSFYRSLSFYPADPLSVFRLCSLFVRYTEVPCLLDFSSKLSPNPCFLPLFSFPFFILLLLIPASCSQPENSFSTHSIVHIKRFEEMQEEERGRKHISIWKKSCCVPLTSLQGREGGEGSEREKEGSLFRSWVFDSCLFLPLISSLLIL